MLLNEPFDPANRQLPKIYFSDDWYWEPDKADLEPRRERWGGLLFALAGLWFYVAAIKRDAIARNLGLFGIVFGALGFAGGQCVQAYHSWNLANFQQGWLGRIEPYMNWWNTMETIFGMILGLGLGLGVWLHRRQLPQAVPDEVELSPPAELACLAAHVASIAVWNFMSFDTFDQVADHALTMGILPLALVVGGRYSPYLMSLPIVAFPIAGKTLREMSYYNQEIPLAYGWSLLFVLPIVILTLAAVYLARRGLAWRQRAVVLAVEPAPDELDVFCPQLRLLPLSLAVGAADIPHAECNRVCRVLDAVNAGLPVLPFAIQPRPCRRNRVMSANVTEWLTQRRRDRRGEPKGTLIGTDPR